MSTHLPFHRYPDTYKRRGQARSAMGNMKGALEDLDKAAKLLETADKDGLGAMMRAQGGEDPRSTAADCYSGENTVPCRRAAVFGGGEGDKVGEGGRKDGMGARGGDTETAGGLGQGCYAVGGQLIRITS